MPPLYTVIDDAEALEKDSRRQNYLRMLLNEKEKEEEAPAAKEEEEKEDLSVVTSLIARFERLATDSNKPTPRLTSQSLAAERKEAERRKKKAEQDKLQAEEMEKLEREAMRVRDEIVASERRYVEQVTLLLQSYLIPLQSQIDTLVRGSSDPDAFTTNLTSLVASLRVMAMLHKNLLNDILDHGDIVRTLESYTDHMKSYCPYVQNFTRVNVHLNSQDNWRLQQFIEKTTRAHNHQSITQLLIAPVQRLPRYVLLLDRLEKHTSADHPDLEGIRRAHQRMKAVADLVTFSLLIQVARRAHLPLPVE